MAGTDDSISQAGLLCHEDGRSFDESEEDQDTRSEVCMSPFIVEDDDDEYVQFLLQREKDCEYGACSVPFNVKSARTEAVEWILNARIMLGFDFHTAYVSVTFFDRFLARRCISEWKCWVIQLLAIACLSLAAKMEESDVPSLSIFSREEHNFTRTMIGKMELLVLLTLEWKMASVTPFSYLNHLIKKIGLPPLQHLILPRVMEITMSMVRDISSLHYPQSVVATAVVLAAPGSKLSRDELESRLKLISWWNTRDNEKLYSCYAIVKGREKREVKTPNGEAFPSSIGTFSKSVSIHRVSRGGIKRRLTYN